MVHKNYKPSTKQRSYWIWMQLLQHRLPAAHAHNSTWAVYCTTSWLVTTSCLALHCSHITFLME